MAEVFARMNLLENKSVHNEAEISYAICNLLISTVCECFGYSLKVEETVKDNLEEGEEVEDVREEAVLVDLRNDHPMVETATESLSPTPMDLGSGRHSIGGAMPQASKADYSIYTKLVAIVDAEKHITPHSTAQVWVLQCLQN